MPVTFKFEGGKELEAALKQLVDDTGKTTAAKAAMRRTLTIAGKIFQASAIEKAPKRTGKLKTSIVVGTKLNRRQKAIRKEIGKSAVEVYVGTADPAGVMQEFGTVKEAAQSFMRPAWDEKQSEVLEKIKTEAWVQVEKTAKRVARKAAKLNAK